MPGKGCKRAKTTEWDTYNPNRLSPSLFCDENVERWVNQPEQTEMFFHLRKGLLLLLRPALKRYIDRRHLELSSWPSLFSSVLRLLVRLPAMTEQAALQAFEDADAYHQVWRLAGPSVKKLILRDAYSPHLGEDSWNAKASFSPPVYEAEKAYHKLHQKSWMASDSSSSSSSTSASSELTCSSSNPSSSDSCSTPSISNLAFAGFHFSIPPESLDVVKRTKCPRCGSSALLYCISCLERSGPVRDLLGDRTIVLPLRIDLVHHPREKLTKSTGLHSAVLAPEQARLVSFPGSVPEYDPESTLLLFPSDKAKYIDELNMPLGNIKTLVFIECTWKGTPTVYGSSNLSSLPHVKLRPRETRFWRTQHLGNECLSTIEAIYYACVEYWACLHPEAPRSPPEWDDLLLFFAWQHHTILARDKKPANWKRPLEE